MPERDFVTFTIDGREVRAPEGEWLLDAAKRGDVEIPYFCYERKLGQPVGACRMCMVEIEGLPKLQVSCATPVKDGMVVYTQTDRVKQAQNAVVEFLLVNHPLDCPVCDKGGECPLQDISYGWGPGRSRFVEAKRNFPKPIALSPLVAIDRERCILCYRCVRFSQEVAEDYQLTFLERGDHTFVGTFDGRPYVAPFAGNVIELCPVGALTSMPYRFRARPWDIVNAGTVCTLCPSHCNVSFTVRDDRVERVLARDNPDVDDGWLCDKGRFAYQAIHSSERITQPLVRDGGLLRPATWERALATAAAGLRKAGASAAAIAGNGTTNEEAYLLQRIFREALGSANLDSGSAAEALDPELVRALARPELSARVADIDRAAAVLVIGTDPINEAPILDLRIRKAVRRFGARLVVAASQPTALDGGASELLSFAPGAEEALLRALQKAMVEQGSADEGTGESRETAARPDSEGGPLPSQQELVSFLAANSLERLAARAGADAGDLRDAAALLVGVESIVVVWGERIASGARGSQALAALVDLALIAGIDGGDTSGLIEIPVAHNGRGLREVGFLPNLGPGLSEVEQGLGARRAAEASERGEVGAFYLLHSDPLREQPDRALWERALAAAGIVVAHAQFLNESIDRHADVVLPAESHAEKEGTVTHPDGRIQRLRPAIGHPHEVRPEWQALVELAHRLGVELELLTAGMVFAEIGDRVPLYRGITLEEIGGRGVRWQEHEPSREAAEAVLGELRFSAPESPPELPSPGARALRLVELPDLWASWETDRSPALSFLRARQQLVLHPDDAARLAVEDGEAVEVASNGAVLHATARLRSNTRPGCAYVVLGTAEENSNLLTNGRPPFVEIRPSAGKPADGFVAG
jgi:NADH-quinone oxidoreductase subunit G